MYRPAFFFNYDRSSGQLTQNAMFSLSLKKQKKNQFIDIPPENGNEETVNNGNDTPSAMAPPTTQGPVTAQNNDVSKLNYDSKTKQEKADTSQSQGYGQTSGTTSNPIVHVPVTHKEPKGFSRTMKSASSWMKDYSTAVKHGRCGVWVLNAFSVGW